MIRYDASVNEVEIKYNYTHKGARKNHTFQRAPILVQYHPCEDNFANEIVRLHFEGFAPTWMKDYAQRKEYHVTEYEGEMAGFSLVRKDLKRFYELPTLKATIMEMVYNMPEECQIHLQPLIDNVHNVIENLTIYKEQLANFGIYFRAEELKGDSGAIYIDSLLFIPGGAISEELILKFKEEWQPIVELLVQEVDYDLLEEKAAIATIELPETVEIEEVITVPPASHKTVEEKPVLEFIEIDLPMIEPVVEMDIVQEGELPETVIVEEVVLLFEEDGTQPDTEEVVVEEDLTITFDDVTVTEEIVISEAIVIDEAMGSESLEQGTEETSEIKELVGIGAPIRTKKPRKTKSFVEGQQYLF